MIRSLLLAALIVLLTGCSALSMVSSLLPSKPALEIGLEVDASEGKKETVETQIGTDTNIKADIVDSISTVNTGFTSVDIVILLVVLSALAGAFGFGCYHIGLRTPRPFKHTAQGRK